MTITMTEQMAKALEAEMDWGDEKLLHYPYEDHADRWREIARAVLISLREPTEGVVNAMYANGAEGDPVQVASDFTAAIDHILRESGSAADPT